MRKPKQNVLLTASIAALAVLSFGSPALADPPGNNGTIKIDSVEFDSAPNNQPHVGCKFEVDFYGYDAGDDFLADVTFTVHPPTGKPALLLTDTIDVGEDAAGGGTDLDASRLYDLRSALRAYDPHPKQGWHVKLEVNAPGSIGADNKFKVFWVEPCQY